MLKRAKRLARLAPALLLGAAVCAQTSTVNLQDPAVIAKGGDVYAKNCAVGYCHGSEGRPARGPDLRNTKWEPRALFEVVHGGIPDTTMPAWKNILSEADIWAVVAYVISLSGQEIESPTVETGPTGSEEPQLSAEAKHGRDLFFDLNNQKRCGLCHKLGRMGTEVGPSLIVSALRKSPEGLMQDILDPDRSIAPGFEQIVVITKSGERVAGVKQEQTDEVVRVYDTTSLPPPLRSFYKDQIHSTESARRSSMPSIYGDVYSETELKAIVAFLESGAF